MATLAIAAAGAVAGNFLGVGASVGWIAGSLLANYLGINKGARSVTEGPRLGDLTVSSSAYGSAIAINYGTVRVSGNVIWSSGIQEHRSESSESSGGKGGAPKSTSTTVTYTYSCSFAIAFGEGPAEDILRIWADSKLIYDKTGTGDVTAVEGFHFRFYPGDEEQLPDSIIEASEGVGNVPAHRGLCYMVFDDLQLADFGNRLPNITAEITYKKSAQHDSQTATFLSGDVTGFSITCMVVDSKRNYAYLLNPGTAAAGGGVRRINLTTMKEDRQRSVDEITSLGDNFNTNLWAIDDDGYLYACTGSSNAQPIVKIDPNSLKEVARFGSDGGSLTNSYTRFVGTSYAVPVEVVTLTGTDTYMLFGSAFNDLGVLTQSMGYVWGDSTTKVTEAMVGGMVAADYGSAYVIGQSRIVNDVPISIYKVSIAQGAAALALPGGGFSSVGVTLEKLATISQESLGLPSTGMIQATFMAYDKNDGRLIFGINFAGTVSKNYILKFDDADGIKWMTDVTAYPGVTYPTGYMNSVLKGSHLAYMTGTNVVQIDTRTGEIVDVDAGWAGINGRGTQWYDSVNDVLVIVTQIPGTVSKLYLNRGSGLSADLAAIVTDVCRRVALDDSDIAVAELTDSVRGFSVGSQMAARSAIETLSQAFLFDGVESDYLLKFLKRGRASSATIAQKDLGLVDDSTNDYWKETRTQEVELPNQVNIVYMDKDTDYEQGSQSAKRISNPTPTMYSNNVTTVTLALVMIATEAAQLAEKLLYNAWLERDNYNAILPWTFLVLDPTDVITVVKDDGTTYTARIATTNVGVDYPIEMTGLSEDAAVYESHVVGNTGLGVPQQEINSSAYVELFVLDLPLLRDQDALPSGSSRLYYAMATYGLNKFPGGILYKSSDGTQYNNVSTDLADVAWGGSINALPAPESSWRNDEENELIVAMIRGEDELASCTQLELVNGANGALLGNEVIQFRDVEDIGNGQYKLTGLLRGRRGTEWAVASHTIGDTFILLSPSTMRAIALTLDEVNALRYYRGVQYGRLFEDAKVVTLSSTGADLKPYAPCHLTAAYSGSNLALAWTRRTRLGGGLKDGTGDVPLAESTESYEIDILAAPGGAVLRTLTSTSANVTYAAADITTDFGTPPTEINFVVYQMSASVGRGFPATATIEV